MIACQPVRNAKAHVTLLANGYTFSCARLWTLFVRYDEEAGDSLTFYLISLVLFFEAAVFNCTVVTTEELMTVRTLECEVVPVPAVRADVANMSVFH